MPSRDPDRSRAFYVETLGLRPDETADYEFWVGDTCFAIWEPERLGDGVHRALATRTRRCTSTTLRPPRAELEAKGVEFFGEILDTGVCHMALFQDPDGNDLMLHHRYAD